MSVSTIEVPLTEQFADAQARLLNYETYDATQRTALASQRHADIRCFVKEVETLPDTMFSLDHETMGDLSDTDAGGPDVARRMDEFVQTVTLYTENWTGGTLAAQSDRNYWHGISVSVPVGTATATSIGPTVDLSAFALTDTLSLAFPSLPAAITRASSFVDFTSHATGDFTAGPTVSIPFTGLASADVELAVPLSTLSPLGSPLRVTAVRFRVTASSICTFRCLAIRVLPSTWLYAPVDVNTLRGRLVRPVSRTGAAATASAFPSNAIVDPQVPTAWPILLRADTPSGAEDPRPIDISEAAVFHTGHMTDGEIRLYFREYAFDLVTQLDLDNAPNTQTVLDAIGHQIDFDKALYRARDQADMDTLPMSTLDLAVQFDLEAEPDYFSAAWIQVSLAWTASTATLTIEDTEGNDHTFEDVTLTADTTYVLIVELRHESARVRIYPLDSLDNIDFANITFDSTLIDNGFIFARRSGRVGWYARLADGNAYVESLRYFSANFAEYRSTPLRSLSPVDGGQVFYGGSGYREGYTGVSSTGDATVTPDTTKSSSEVCFRVDVEGTAPQSGVVTNAVFIDNFDTARVDFDLYLPSDVYNAGGRIFAYLSDAFGQPHALNLGRVPLDQMQPYRLDLQPFHGQLLPGNYALNVVVLQPTVRGMFYVDRVSIRQRALVWSGRSDASDPWGDHGVDWIPFREALNSRTAGVLFAGAGTSPQIRAQARYQNASLTRVTFVPRYSMLGRLVWSDDCVGLQRPVVSAFAATVSGLGVTFAVPSANVTVASGNWLAYYEWSFGDGTSATGPNVQHTYDETGVYLVNLMVADNEGAFGTVSGMVVTA